MRSGRPCSVVPRTRIGLHPQQFLDRGGPVRACSTCPVVIRRWPAPTEGFPGSSCRGASDRHGFSAWCSPPRPSAHATKVHRTSTPRRLHVYLHARKSIPRGDQKIWNPTHESSATTSLSAAAARRAYFASSPCDDALPGCCPDYARSPLLPQSQPHGALARVCGMQSLTSSRNGLSVLGTLRLQLREPLLFPRPQSSLRGS